MATFANTTPTTSGEVNAEVFGKNWERFEFRERIDITLDSSSAASTKKIPARCRVLMAYAKAASAVSVAGGETATADGFVVTWATSAGALSSLTTNATTQWVLGFGATLTSNTAVFNSPPAAGYYQNTTTSEQTVYLLPYDSGGSRYLEVNTTNATTGNHFDATGNVDVILIGEKLIELADN